MSTKNIIRRIVWMLYAVPITLLILPGDFLAIYSYGPGMFPFAALDMLLSYPSLVAIQLHIWDQPLLPRVFWKIYAFVFPAWDFTFNILIEPAITNQKFDPSNLIFAVFCLPLYVAIFGYGFRKWPKEEVLSKIDSN